MSKMSSILKKNSILIVCAITLIGCATIIHRVPSSENASDNTVRIIDEEEASYNEVTSGDDLASLTPMENTNSIEGEELVDEEIESLGDADDALLDEVLFFESQSKFDYAVVPDFSESASYIINNNVPFFTSDDKKWEPGLEVYPPVDELDRCQTVYACIGLETMPVEGEERESIGMIKPSGWHTIKYPDIIDDLYLYNRCHLIGWQLGGENANENNLITGTRFLNVSGMLPYENRVAEYINDTGNHVLYRVTPYFMDQELVARGVLIEAESVEDDGLSFCVWCYNVQPGITIDYLTGDSFEAEVVEEQQYQVNEEIDLVLNTNTMRAHLTTCSSVHDIKPENRMDFHGTIDEIQEMGFVPCGNCHPF